MISANFIVFGNQFSGQWINNWTGTLSFLGQNKFNVTWEFFDTSEPLIQLNHTLQKNASDWTIIASSDTIIHREYTQALLLNDTYDAITGWKYRNATESNVVKELDMQLLSTQNKVSFAPVSYMLRAPIPFSIQYCPLSLIAFKTHLLHNQFFEQKTVINTVTNKKILLPWTYSVCKQFIEYGHEIYVNPQLIFTDS